MKGSRQAGVVASHSRGVVFLRLLRGRLIIVYARDVADCLLSVRLRTFLRQATSRGVVSILTVRSTGVEKW